MIYYTQNNIGSTTLLTDKNGSDIGQFLYTPFGEMWVEEASTVDISHITRFFTNQQYDKESGLYYYNARYYDPHLGSFITPDPAMDSLNHYAYCDANPINYTDPTGLYGKFANSPLIAKDIIQLEGGGGGGGNTIIIGASVYALFLAIQSKGEKNRERAWERSEAKKAQKESSNKPDFKDLKPDPNKPDPKNIKGVVGFLTALVGLLAKLFSNKEKMEEEFNPDKLKKDDKPKLENQDKEEDKDKELDLINDKVKDQIENDVNDDTYSNNPDNKPQQPNLTPNNNTQDNTSNSGNTSESSGGSSTSSSEPWYSSYSTSSWWY